MQNFLLLFSAKFSFSFLCKIFLYFLVQNFVLLFSEKFSFTWKTKRKYLAEKEKEITDTTPFVFSKISWKGGICSVPPDHISSGDVYTLLVFVLRKSFDHPTYRKECRVRGRTADESCVRADPRASARTRGPRTPRGQLNSAARTRIWRGHGLLKILKHKYLLCSFTLLSLPSNSNNSDPSENFLKIWDFLS